VRTNLNESGTLKGCSQFYTEKRDTGTHAHLKEGGIVEDDLGGGDAELHDAVIGGLHNKAQGTIAIN